MSRSSCMILALLALAVVAQPVAAQIDVMFYDDFENLNDGDTPDMFAPSGSANPDWDNVVLDPFTYTQRQRGGQGRDNWHRSLGKSQYDWLKNTLEASKADLKFVFIHHLVGGLDHSGRGGSEAAALYEERMGELADCFKLCVLGFGEQVIHPGDRFGVSVF